MASQTQNALLWTKLFVLHGVTGIRNLTKVNPEILYRIKNDKDYVPTPLTQRKLSSGLGKPIEELFPFTVSDGLKQAA